ncbi:MAG TPA: hypothetical protein VFV43_07255, partial [Limnobacter sp.]|nr:hypothetical protein [Limnobacter sp.]
LAKEELTKDNPNLSLLNELLTREFGVSAHAVYNCDECKPLEFKEIEKNLFTQLFKDAKIEDHAAKPTPAEETHAMHAFLGKGRLTSGRDTISARRFFDHAITASVAANNAAQKDPLTDEEKKRQAQERLHVMRDSIHRATQHLTDG